MRARFIPGFPAFLIGVLLLADPAGGQPGPAPGTIAEIALPGGLPAALKALDDLVPADRSQFLLEFIRRSHTVPLTVRNVPRDTALRAVLTHLDEAGRAGTPGRTVETLPLPLPAATWLNVVFKGRESPQTLLSAILRTRGPALLYYGLLSLDDETRAWLGTQTDLIADLSTQHAAAFVIAAPGLRVSGAAIRVPGGERAETVWEALVGRQISNPAAFVRALLGQAEGRLAYFYGAMAQLTPAQLRFALDLESSDGANRVAAARRLYAVFERVADKWRVDERTFWRPPLDPALLVADLSTDATGRPFVPGTRRFWAEAFSSGEQSGNKPRVEDDGPALVGGAPIDFAGLCEQVFTEARGEHRTRYRVVQFASRMVAQVSPETARDTLEALRAVDAYPALIATLERAKLRDIAAFAQAARRAARLGSIEDHGRAARALAQYQGALSLLTRAAVRGSVSPAMLAKLVSSLSAVDVSERGDYEGRLVAWFGTYLRESAGAYELPAPAGGSMEAEALRMLSGPSTAPRFVEWEGTRYRVDFPSAETTRIARLLGEQSRPFMSSARTLLSMANDLEVARRVDGLRPSAAAFQQIAEAVGWATTDGWGRTDVPQRYHETAAALKRLIDAADVAGAVRVAVSMRTLADELLARGLTELTYAIALGQPDRTPISADDAASRHDFGMRSAFGRRASPWRFPVAGVDPARGWLMTGSLLGLDVRLADFSLRRLSSRPPPRRPTVEDDHRRVLIETVALVSTSLTDVDRDTIVAAMHRGRARLAGVRTPSDALALADEIRLSPARRSLLPWVFAHDPGRFAGFLSPSELLWLGLDKMPLAATLDGWGVAAEPRLGCLCLQLLDRRPWETLAGRWHSGILVSGFAELNLRLSELLAGLRMPAALLGPVLAPATQELVDMAVTRDPDDRRGLVEFVQALRPERVEQYLALLTTDGPLVPVETAGPSDPFLFPSSFVVPVSSFISRSPDGGVRR